MCCVWGVRVCVLDIERNQTLWREMCVYVTESYILNWVFTKRLCMRDGERCAGLEVGRGRVRVSKCAR